MELEEVIGIGVVGGVGADGGGYSGVGCVCGGGWGNRFPPACLFILRPAGLTFP